jgi:excisionase family DNA binding protein
MQQTKKTDELLKFSEACALAKVNRYTLEAAVAARELTIVIMGERTRRIWKSELLRWLKTKERKGLAHKLVPEPEPAVMGSEEMPK